MFLTGTMKINAQGHLVIGGIDTLELVKEFGTPYGLWTKKACVTTAGF